MQTYTLGTRRPLVLHIVGSTSSFLMTVNAIVAGTLGALVAAAFDGGPAAMTVAGVLGGGLAYVGVSLLIASRVFSPEHPDSRFPSSPTQPTG